MLDLQMTKGNATMKKGNYRRDGTLRRLRRGIPLTQRAAAQRVGITYQYLSSIERGKVRPSPYTADKLAKLYGIPYARLWRVIKRECAEGGNNA